MSRLLNAVKYLLRYSTPLPRQPVAGYQEWTLLRDVLRDYRINLVLDVGANQGQYARNLRRVGYQGHICSFEPIPEAFDAVSKKMEGDLLWRGYNYALAREDGELTFHVAEESTVMSSFLAPVSHDWRLRDLVVAVRRLDNILPDVIAGTGETSPRIFLKVDTQGYDLEVVAGAAGGMDSIIGLQSEISMTPIYVGMPHYLEALNTYEGLGFHLCGLSEVMRFPHNNVLAEMNCVMVRPEMRDN